MKHAPGNKGHEFIVIHTHRRHIPQNSQLLSIARVALLNGYKARNSKFEGGNDQ
jgi:hypothetical protein